MQGAQVDSGEIMAEISDKNSELIAEFALTKMKQKMFHTEM